MERRSKHPNSPIGHGRIFNVRKVLTQLSPDTTTVFYCPMRQDSVAWESSDTFNPAATIYDGKVVVLYRAEDNSAVGIGSRTSRLGYAYSDDGLHFNRMTVPVFYPADDNQKELEWPGGCEDPRVAVTEDGLMADVFLMNFPNLLLLSQNW